VGILRLFGWLLVVTAAGTGRAEADTLRCPRALLIGQVTHLRDGDTIEVGGLANVRTHAPAPPATWP
jgi:hypothetical protein